MRFIKRGIGAALCLALTVAAMPAAFAKDFTVQLPVTESTAIPSLKDDFYLHTDGAWIKSAKIPKDDMLGFLIPFSGVGNATAIIALTIYALLPMDQGVIQQYASPQELLKNPATSFVRQLVGRERHTCYLSEDRLGSCEYSGASYGGKENR